LKAIKWIGVVLVVLVAALGALYVAMAERVGVIFLHTHDAEGDHETRLWILDDAGAAWLRTGADNATWLPRLRTTPAIQVVRDGAVRPYTAVVVEDPATVARIDELTLAKYGWSESLLRAMSPAGRGQVAIRLDPR
jgi:hypothetical protein